MSCKLAIPKASLERKQCLLFVPSCNAKLFLTCCTRNKHSPVELKLLHIQQRRLRAFPTAEFRRATAAHRENGDGLPPYKHLHCRNIDVHDATLSNCCRYLAPCKVHLKSASLPGHTLWSRRWNRIMSPSCWMPLRRTAAGGCT